jgi:hypothetical protein
MPGFARDPIAAVYFFALVACVLVMTVRLVARRWRRRKLTADGEARCAGCAYILVSGSSTVCPECGRDVRESGLLTPTAPLPPVGLGPVYLFIALICLLPAARIVWALYDWHPFGWTFHASTMIRVQAVERARICVQAEGDGRYFGRRTRHLMIYRNDGGDPAGALIWVRPDDLVAITRAKSSADTDLAERPLDRAMIVRLIRLSTGGTALPQGAEDPAVSRAADDMLAAARKLAAGDLPHGTAVDMTADVAERATYHLNDWVPLGSTLIVSVALGAIGSLVVRRIARVLLVRKQNGWRLEAAQCGLRDATRAAG